MNCKQKGIKNDATFYFGLLINEAVLTECYTTLSRSGSLKISYGYVGS